MGIFLMVVGITICITSLIWVRYDPEFRDNNIVKKTLRFIVFLPIFLILGFFLIKLLNYNFDAEKDAKNLIAKYIGKGLKIEIIQLSEEFYKKLHASGWPPTIAFKTDKDVELDFDSSHCTIESTGSKYQLPETYKKYYSTVNSSQLGLKKFMQYQNDNLLCTANLLKSSGDGESRFFVWDKKLNIYFYRGPGSM